MSLHSSDPLLRLRDELILSLTTQPEADLRFAFGFRTKNEGIGFTRSQERFDRKLTWDGVASSINPQRPISMKFSGRAELPLYELDIEQFFERSMAGDRSHNLYGHLVGGVFCPEHHLAALSVFNEKAVALERLSRQLAIERETQFRPMMENQYGWFGLVCRLVLEFPKDFSFGLAFDSYCVDSKHFMTRLRRWDTFEAATEGLIAVPLGVYLMWPTREARIASIEAIDCLRRLYEALPWSADNGEGKVEDTVLIDAARTTLPPLLPAVNPSVGDLVDRLHKEGKSKQAKLIGFMSARESSEFQDIAVEVHGDSETPDQTIRKLVSRTNQSLVEAGSPMHFRVASSQVHKEISPE